MSWLPLHLHLENFIYAWNSMENPPLWRLLLNSTIVTVSRTLLVLFVSTLTAYALAVYRFWGRRLIFFWVLSQVILQNIITLMPSIVILLPLYVLMVWLGWFNTYWALILPAVFNAYSIFLLRQYIITIPNDLLDAARLSGCSEFGLYWRIVLPLSKPAIAAIALLNAGWTWNEFLWPALMIKNESWYTVQMVLGSAGGSPFGPGPIGAAVITLVISPLIIFTLVTQKYLMKGFAGFGYSYR